MAVLQDHCKISSDWKGKRYLGMHPDWDFDISKVHFSMIGYGAEDLTRFCHKHLHKPQNQPYPHIKPNYGEKSQYDEAIDDSPPLSK